jgi:hypothetical protein
MGKLILHEFAFNKVTGNQTDKPNSVAYSKVTSCLTITCICPDGTVAGGHIVMVPFSFWYVTSHLVSLISNREISKVVVIGSSTWNNPNTLQALFNAGTDEEYLTQISGASLANEKKTLAQIIAYDPQPGIQNAIESILGKNGLDFFVGLYGGELDIVFEGGPDSVTLDIQGAEMTFPYKKQATVTTAANAPSESPDPNSKKK